MSVETTLAERGNRYGDFTDHACVAQALQNVMRTPFKDNSHGWPALSDVQKQALTVIADKIARILSGDPNYADNWHDIQGYAKLVEDRLPTAPKLVRHVWFSPFDSQPFDVASVVEVELRDGNHTTPDRIWRWNTSGEPDDVVAIYRREA